MNGFPAACAGTLDGVWTPAAFTTGVGTCTWRWTKSGFNIQLVYTTASSTWGVLLPFSGTTWPAATNSSSCVGGVFAGTWTFDLPPGTVCGAAPYTLTLVL